jgi:hypothetical protein
MANKHRKVWKVVSRKVNSGKQTWPKFRSTPRGTIGHIRKKKRKRKRKELTLAIGGCFSHGYAFLSLFLVKKVNK